jgi:hypothetical protein
MDVDVVETFSYAKELQGRTKAVFDPRESDADATHLKLEMIYSFRLGKEIRGCRSVRTTVADTADWHAVTIQSCHKG